MTEKVKAIRLGVIAKELNIGIGTIIEHLNINGFSIESNPNTKLTAEMLEILVVAFGSERSAKEKSQQINLNKPKNETIAIEDVQPKKSGKFENDQDEIFVKNLGAIDVESEDSVKTKVESKKTQDQSSLIEKKKKIGFKVVDKIDLTPLTKKSRPKEILKDDETNTPDGGVNETTANADVNTDEKSIIRVKNEKLQGLTIVDKINLPQESKKNLNDLSGTAQSDLYQKKKKRKRKITSKPISINEGVYYTKPNETTWKKPFFGNKKFKKGKIKPVAPIVSEKEIQEQVKSTLALLTGATKSKAAKYRKQKREEIATKQRELQEIEAAKKVIQITEFLSANELAQMVGVSVNEVISVCLNLGIFVSINQRLDAETITLVADEFGYEVEFVSADVQESIPVVEDNPEDLVARPPVVTIMGHVDHGKTSLLDYIRKTNVIAGEAGGITQHIGAYEVELENKKKITFIDTPGHEAFTAMRARGAKITDLVIIVVAADDKVMPQTKEAINHAQAARVPMIFAINKIDKETANPDSIKEQLSHENILVEDWGGKYLCQAISAKKGSNVDLLLEKVLFEAEVLELKANPNKLALGTVIEATQEKGKGIVTTLLVQGGTLKVGDIILAGCQYGKVKALFNERGIKISEALPSTPVQILGLEVAPQAGDEFNILENESEAKKIANKRSQLQREQGIRTRKHITLDEIGRRLAIGNFKELNVIIKGDVDGSVEALTDTMLKLSTEQVKVNVIHKSVGQISDSDVLLASASDAIIIGFQVRPSLSSRKLAEKEQIDIRLYSIIYDAIEAIKSAIQGMSTPTTEERIISNVEVRETYKISKVGTVAGCYVLDGKINRNTKIRLVRDGIVTYSGNLSSLKRFKDDVKEVSSGFECGLTIHNYNDIKVGDVVEGYEVVEVNK